MKLFWSYSLKHLLDRRTSAMLTVFGIALVVFVFAAAQMLDAGLQKTLSGTGSADNIIVTRNGAQNEIQSGIPRDNVALILTDIAVSTGANGAPRGSAETVVIVSLSKRADGGASNVTVRGQSAASRALRNQAHLIQGHWPTPGTAEIVVGDAVLTKFADTDIGKTIRMAGIDWPVVGVFTAGDSGFSSELWGDVDVMASAFRRDKLSTVIFKLKAGTDIGALKERLENDRRLTVSVKTEQQFYADQSKILSKFISILGTFISITFSLGATVGAAITMYSNVANRIREIAVVRALGFKARDVFVAFLSESMTLALVGGLIGLCIALLLTFASISTVNFSTFSDLRFGFYLNGSVALHALLFALFMGVLGGALPSLRAARLNIKESLRE